LRGGIGGIIGAVSDINAAIAATLKTDYTVTVHVQRDGATGSGLGGNGIIPIGAPSFASGVTDFRGGLAYVHAGEVLANLPRGTDVIPRSAVSQGRQNVDASISIQALTIVQQPGQDIRDTTNAVLDEIEKRQTMRYGHLAAMYGGNG
jgi:hypothetical protein